jgi:hypothetical protein
MENHLPQAHGKHSIHMKYPVLLGLTASLLASTSLLSQAIAAVEQPTRWGFACKFDDPNAKGLLTASWLKIPGKSDQLDGNFIKETFNDRPSNRPSNATLESMQLAKVDSFQYQRGGLLQISEIDFFSMNLSGSGKPDAVVTGTGSITNSGDGGIYIEKVTCKIIKTGLSVRSLAASEAVLRKIASSIVHPVTALTKARNHLLQAEFIREATCIHGDSSDSLIYEIYYSKNSPIASKDSRILVYPDAQSQESEYSGSKVVSAVASKGSFKTGTQEIAVYTGQDINIAYADDGKASGARVRIKNRNSAVRKLVPGLRSGEEHFVKQANGDLTAGLSCEINPGTDTN